MDQPSALDRLERLSNFGGMAPSSAAGPTVVSCTPTQADPNKLRLFPAPIHACVDIIQRYDGYVAQYLGDGLLVYFGCPQAHEDDAQRAVRAGLGILEAIIPP
ncbi:MAG TPA: hypothetical protein VNP04_27120 [Alphaproteobacteria bacterium]|nr:hypothetical protein [Alphaproteobacteria bacterium]